MLNASRGLIGLLTAIAVCLLCIPGRVLAQCELSKTVADDAAAGDGFGGAVAIDGAHAVIGAPFDDDNGLSSGAAYVLGWVETQWSQQEKLVATDGEEGDQFGNSVGISGDWAVLGAPRHGSGAAYVFRNDGGVWQEHIKLVADDGGQGDRFGWQVAIDGDRIAVGAPMHDVDQTARLGLRADDAGAVYVFVRDAGGTPADDVWALEDKLEAPDASAGDQLGASVSVSGDVVLAGAPAPNDSPGAAYVFRRVDQVWLDDGTLSPSPSSSFHLFGTSVSVKSTRAAVGAIFGNPTGDAAPGVFVYEYSGSIWSEQNNRQIGRAGILQESWTRVAIAGDTVLVGAPLAQDARNPAGVVAVLDRAQGSWEVWDSFSATDGAFGDEFGRGLALGDGYAVVGAPGDDDGGAGSGSAYLLWGATQPDCNNTQSSDFCDIFNGAADADTNGIPDECEECPDTGCDDGVFCNGEEFCDAQLDRCQPGIPPCVEVELCDEANRECDDCDEDADCADGLFCNGDEWCHSSGFCRVGDSPCAATEVCDEVNEVCTECTVDADCDDGLFCTGTESCASSGACQPGTAPCTQEQVCDEFNEECDACRTDSECDDGTFCNGAESCDATGACRPGSEPCADGLICDEEHQECDSCDADIDCNDGLYCNGQETCSSGGSCSDGAPPCPADKACDEDARECRDCNDDLDCRDNDACTADTCVGGVCVHSPVALCDDLDQDGVNNQQDACPGSPSGSAVDVNGCACTQLDSDGDGVNNCDDACAGTPRLAKVDGDGCPVEPAPGDPAPPGDDSGTDGQSGDDADPDDDDLDAPADDDAIEEPAADPVPGDDAATDGTGQGETPVGAGTGTVGTAGSRGGGATCGLLGMATPLLAVTGFVVLRGRRRSLRRAARR